MQIAVETIWGHRRRNSFSKNSHRLNNRHSLFKPSLILRKKYTGKTFGYYYTWNKQQLIILLTGSNLNFIFLLPVPQPPRCLNALVFGVVTSGDWKLLGRAWRCDNAPTHSLFLTLYVSWEVRIAVQKHEGRERDGESGWIVFCSFQCSKHLKFDLWIRIYHTPFHPTPPVDNKRHPSHINPFYLVSRTIDKQRQMRR
jgi:hypothetical protein